MTTITHNLPWFIKDLGVSLIGEVSQVLRSRIAALSNQLKCFSTGMLHIARWGSIHYSCKMFEVRSFKRIGHWDRCRWLDNEAATALPQYAPCILFEFSLPTDALMVGDSSQRTLCTRAFLIIILPWNTGLFHKHDLFVSSWISIFNLRRKLLSLTPECYHCSLNHTLSAVAVIQLQQTSTTPHFHFIVDVAIYSLFVDNTPLVIGISTSCDSSSGRFRKTTSNNAEFTS